MLTHVDLFSGIGGFALAAEWAGFRTVVFCEIDEFCQEALKARFGAVAESVGTISRGKISGTSDDKRRKDGPTWREGIRPEDREAHPNNIEPSHPVLIPDIRDFDGTRFRGATLLTGGFPCQPFSVAGKRRGKEDDRAIWPEMLRVIHESRPTWVIGENVSGIIRMELDQVLSDLEMEGYTCRTFHIGAVAVNAPHRRMRVWIVAHRKSERLEGGSPGVQEGMGWGYQRPDSDAPDTGECPRLNGFSWPTKRAVQERDKQSFWDTPWPEVATRFCRVDDGVSTWIHAHRVQRLKALGNSIVPQVAYEIIKGIAEIEKGDRR